MKSRTKYISLAIVIVLALSLSACERSASQPPQEPLATPEEPGMGVVENLVEPTPQAGEVITEPGLLTPENGQPDLLPPINEEQQTPVPGETPLAGEPTPLAGEPTPLVAPQPFIEPARPATYILQRGEFPYCIARRFNVDPRELLALNALSAAESRSLQPGLQLQIPQTGAAFPGNRSLLLRPATYVVASNDTLFSIACKFGDVYPEHIGTHNGLTAPYTLTPGQMLNIP